VLVFGNCWQANPNVTFTSALSVRIHGTVDFLSFVSAATLPFFLTLTVCHVLLCLWYRRLMSQNTESRIMIEQWIFYTLILAAVAVSLQSLLYTAQTISSVKKWLYLQVCAQFALSMAHAVSRCLYLLLAMGVGVTTPRVNSTRTTFAIACLLGIYLFCETVDSLSNIYGFNAPFYNLAATLEAYLGMILWVWIPVEVRKTIRYLEFRNESHKVERYHQIFMIYLLAAVLTLLQYAVLLFDLQYNAGRDYSFMDLTETGDAIYLVILACMCWLWRPNPSQQMYSYQLLDETGEFPTHNLSLELSEDVFQDEIDEDHTGKTTL